MTAAVSIIMALAALAAIAFPFFRTTRLQARRLVDDAQGASGFGRELESDLRTGIISQDEYEELAGGPAGQSAVGEVVEPTATSEALESDIERRVRELRQKKGGAQTAAPKPTERATRPPQAAPQAAAKKTGVCPKCGRPYKPGARFCTACGTRLTGGAR